MAQCKHFDVCGVEWEDLPDEGYCILHNPDEDKNQEQFDEALKRHRSKKGSDFRYVYFPPKQNFSGAIFEDRASFDEATFEGGVSFEGTTFKGEAWFVRATFKGKAYFSRATFENWTSFGRATFESGVWFGWATFSEQTTFYRTDFRGKVSFREVKFLGRVLFAGQAGARLFGTAGRAGVSEIDLRGFMAGASATLAFRDVDLSRARLLNTDLRQIEFTSVQWVETRTGKVCVYDEVRYEEESVAGDEGGGFSRSLPWERLERLYRELKQNYEDRRDYARAGDFHFREKEMRRQNPGTSRIHRGLLWLYKKLGGYGERVIPPLLWLIVLIVLSTVVYAFDSTPKPPASTVVRMSADSTVTDFTPAQSPDTQNTSQRSTPAAAHTSVYDALLYSSGTAFFLRPDDLVLGAVAKGMKLIEAILGPIFLGLLALAIRQRLKR